MPKRFITEHEDFKRHNKRTRSPVLGNDMTPAELEEELDALIPRVPSFTDRFKNAFGMETSPKHDPSMVEIARRMVQSKQDSDIKKDEKNDAEIAMRRARKKYEEAAKIQQKENELERQRRQAAASAAAEAHIKRKEQLPNPITAQHIRDAESNYQDWRVAADRSATTNKFVPHEHSYPNSSSQRDGALQNLIALKASFAEQPQKAHEWLMNAWNNEIEQRKRRRFFGGHGGLGAEAVRQCGKSKRVKSKRNKRSTKRRNARK